MLTTGDPGLVARHREDFWEQLNCGNVDVLCANRSAPLPQFQISPHPQVPVPPWCKAVPVQVIDLQQISSSQNVCVLLHLRPCLNNA